MQLLGIYIMKEQAGITKVLKPDWYPFGDYRRPALGKIVKVNNDACRHAAKQVYQRDGLPEISVNCIVGMNGSGKSSLLDIFYRMINNYAFRMLGTKGVKATGRELKYARGVYADLFYICEGVQYKLSCRDIQTTLYKNESGDTFSLVMIKDSEDPKVLLREFFYTISTNYSLYAFNENEYVLDDVVANINADVNGDWLKGLFHKNDGYYTPIVITPYREKGNINVEKENRLASQRVMVLALLAKAQQNSLFIPYEPHTINYSLDREYKEKTETQFRMSVFEQYKSLDISLVIRAFESAWEGYFDTSYYDRNLLDEDKELHELGLFYLAYKTVKICLKYEDYKKLLNITSLVRASEKGISELMAYINKNIPARAKAVIRKITDEINDGQGGRSHITLKLSVCKEFIESLYNHRKRWGIQGCIEVDGLIKVSRIRSYNDAVEALPPAIYNLDMKFAPTKDNVQRKDSSWLEFEGLSEDGEFTINKMSSGERQMLYNLSYVLYHLKNIQSVKEDENRVAYHNVCLVFDEIELYFHPDYQRRFLGMLLEAISWCNIDPKKIHSIQILIVTHSPFILTDILTQNTLYLKKGIPQKVTQQTFGGNYYDLLKSSFFFESSAIGDVAANTLNDWIKRSNMGELIAAEILPLVGDDLIRSYLSR